MKLLPGFCLAAAFASTALGQSFQQTTIPSTTQPSESQPAPPPPPSPTPARPGDNAKIVSVSFSGNGCPQRGAGGKYANHTGEMANGQDLTYHNFAVVYDGARYPPTDRTSNCQMHMSTTGGDAGWQVSSNTITYGGVAVLDPETTASFFLTTYWSQDSSYTFTSQTSLSNPDTQRVPRFVNTSVRNEVWSPCGQIGILNVNFRASVSSRNATSLAYFGPLEILGRETSFVTSRITYKWRRC